MKIYLNFVFVILKMSMIICTNLYSDPFLGATIDNDIARAVAQVNNAGLYTRYRGYSYF